MNMREKFFMGFMVVLLAVFAGACGSTGAAPAASTGDSQAETPNQGETAAQGEFNVSCEPPYFSPDGDGDNDELSIIFGGSAGGTVAGWTFDILQPEQSPRAGQVFKHFEGQGVPTEKLTWDGRSDPIDNPRRANNPNAPATFRIPVQSATEYPYVCTLKDIEGNELTSLKGTINVDVLVNKQDDGRLRIRVPSIAFRSGAADFDGLPDRVVQNNERVVRRIAASLNRFADYKVSIEGHANPENAPGTKQRQDEERVESAKGSVSELRAQKVLDMLAADGVAKNRMTAVGLGVSKPVVEFDDKDNVWQNRRVEFYLNK